MDKYYCVAPLSDRPAEPDPTWFETLNREHGCVHWAPEPAMDVILRDLGENLPMNFVDGLVIPLLRSDFLEALGPLAQEYLMFGRVFDPAHQSLENVCTIGSNCILRIRGGPKSTRQFCAKCGRFLYFPMGKRYLLRENLTGQPIYYGDFANIVIKENIYRTLRSYRFPKVDLYELPVLEEPKDGLPSNLASVRPEDL